MILNYELFGVFFIIIIVIFYDYCFMYMSIVFKVWEFEYVIYMCMNMFMIKNVFY